jgi:integrase
MTMTTPPNPDSTTAVPTAADVARQKAAIRVANWRPRGIDRHAPEPADVAFTRAAVGSVADLRSAQFAGELLAACRSYAGWLLAAGKPLERATAFSDSNIEAYASGPLSRKTTGTRVATRSHLRRIGAAMASADGVPSEDFGGAASAHRVAQTLDSYVPQDIDASRFATVESLVRSAAHDSHPTTVKQVQCYIRNATYLACWVDAHGRPVRLDVVFHPDTIEQFAAAMVQEVTGGRLKARSAATMAAALRTMSRALLPGLSPAQRTVHGRITSVASPYAPDEVDSLIAAADRSHSRSQRRHLLAFICLGLGTGAHAAELNRVRPGDVTLRGDGRTEVLLTGRGHPDRAQPTRTVLVHEPYGAVLRDLADEARDAEYTWLLGGESEGIRDARSATLCETTKGRWAPELSIQRLRTTFLVALIEVPCTAIELLNALGTSTLAPLDALVRGVRDVHIEAAP